ncbi:predicted protein [Phaeodactylum tricornutum CCAP 1055/1]|jgi:solute carrier family 35 protein E1|uniref:Sugar phosphate transporter domain-containing protein n=1 Tax=Phaeodactylum tricornutum (strain CCAP 1055/1) TaxID=556484 RepID=B7G197_PHATC|nr:predicted protein [Phaeodactylum tricornutum CCAP 1055/1]EEC47468.1 predicted protein [Phaeodactylum tricornutum CCAP 1055/1]|eukprot:XP_002180816.1 predicted protein [Phaeodactylum tricornutum CCAP 1055/1]
MRFAAWLVILTGTFVEADRVQSTQPQSASNFGKPPRNWVSSSAASGSRGTLTIESATGMDHSQRTRRTTLDTRGGAATKTTNVKLRVASSRAVVAPTAAPHPLLHTLKVGFYFALWYALNIVYNILNKKLLNVLPSPVTVGSIQFGVGCFYVLLVWALKLRPAPTLTSQGKAAVQKVGFWHCTGQLASMVSLGAGPVSFTHIVKALEPFFSAVVSALAFGTWMKPQVYATLLPVVGGVGYACLKERSFSWLAFYMAMGSNLAFALRAVLSKVAMSSGANVGTNISSTNVFAMVTLAAFVWSIPMALVTEGRSFGTLWNKALSQQSAADLCKALFVSGMFHYLNNEVMYLALGNVHPVTLAVGNTMKRVIIMVASVMVFQNEITPQAAVGSAIGIAGVLLYSLTKQYYEKLEAKRYDAIKQTRKKR